MKSSILISILIVSAFATTAVGAPFVSRDLPAAPGTAESWYSDDMVAGDVDDDGIEELVVAWSDAATRTKHVAVTYRWYAGELREVTRINLGTFPGMAWVYLKDTDTDGQLELITVEGGGDSGSPLTIYEWSAAGWSADWTITLYSLRRGDILDVGDLDGDLLNEIVVAVDWYGRYLGVIDYDAATMNYTMSHTIGGNDFRSASIADVNGDGQLDIIAGTANWSYWDGRVYTWNGSSYSLLWDSAFLGDVTATAFDHDGNGVADVVLANRASPHVSGQNGLHIYEWSGSTFQFQYTLSPNVPLIAPKSLDFDSDGIMDLVAISVDEDHNGAYSGDGLHFYQRSGEQLIDYGVLAGVIGGSGATIDGCDLDNDGYNEMVLAGGNVAYGPTGYWIQHVAACPIITCISDVPLDNGRMVRVTWARAAADNADDTPFVQDYRVWRRVRADLKAAGSEVMTSANGELFELVGETPGMTWDKYALIVPTLADEGEIADPLFDFMVTAHLSDLRTHHASPVQQGYSIDQTAPAAPEGLVGAFVPYSVTLSWDRVDASDLSHYNVYRVVDGSEILLRSTPATGFTDYTAGMDVFGFLYRVSASDWAGNESEKVEIAASGISGTPGDLTPQLMATLSAYPNPFNPATTVRFSLPVAGNVRISVYDVAGRKVRDLVDAAFAAGNHQAMWDGQDDRGRTVGAGAYIMRMTSGRYELNYRVALVK